ESARSVLLLRVLLPALLAGPLAGPLAGLVRDPVGSTVQPVMTSAFLRPSVMLFPVILATSPGRLGQSPERRTSAATRCSPARAVADGSPRTTQKSCPAPPVDRPA